MPEQTVPEQTVAEPTVPAPIVTVRGEARLEGPPDLATLSVTLHASGDTAAAVRTRLASGSTQIAQLVQTYGAALESSSTSGLHVAPVFGRRTPARISGYSGTFTAQLVLHDFEALSPVVLAATKLPDSQVDGPWWSLRADNPLHREVRIAAIADARTRAEDYAAAFDATLAGLVEVSDLESSFGGGGGMRAFAMARGVEDDRAIDFEPALQTVSGQVTVRFALRIGGVPER